MQKNMARSNGSFKKSFKLASGPSAITRKENINPNVKGGLKGKISLDSVVELVKMYTMEAKDCKQQSLDSTMMDPTQKISLEDTDPLLGFISLNSDPKTHDESLGMK